MQFIVVLCILSSIVNNRIYQALIGDFHYWILRHYLIDTIGGSMRRFRYVGRRYRPADLASSTKLAPNSNFTFRP